MAKKFEVKFKFNLRNFFTWLLVGFLILSFFFSLKGPIPQGEKNLAQVLNDIKEEKVEEVGIEGETLLIKYKDGGLYNSRKEPQVSFDEILRNAEINPLDVNFEVKDQSMLKAWGSILEILLPVVLTGIIFLWIFRQARGAQDSIFSFGKSKAKLFSKGKQKVKFTDVGGVDEAKKELEEVVDFLKHPKKYQALGARTPKGVLLVGPSGTGKTLLAQAVAGEANVPFFSMAGSEFMEMLVGVGASRVRDLFSTAKKAGSSIIFIDEIDAIGRARGLGASGGHDEREQTLNQILVEMDGFSPNDNVIIVAATNRADLLDSALMRPGRFDRLVVLDLPDIEGRKKIVEIHRRGKPFDKSVSWEKAARRTVGFSGADLENMLNEAAIKAARENKKAISWDDIEEAATKVKLGPEKKRLQTDLDRLMTAYHEAGHAVVTYNLSKMDTVHRVSIVSRGMALGYTLIPPKRDRIHETQSHLLETIVSLLGGRAAEEIKFNEFTSGASSDIAQATRIARKMVIEYGMSELGPINLGPQIDVSDWGKSYFEPSKASPEMSAQIDKEIKKIIDEAYIKAIKILKEKRKKMDLLARELVKKETIEDEEFEALMKK
ncbi:cell division protein FtsH [Candidatus Beckwithbacteria bacterium CG10_big_fil_rev_8_21_14_0_10_34_10]|uniref:ATP-dependent zinc metalloprotease FtsH n=1 Tax=Candidatus Beckwithbacteria bacterium CG10_big_fil_rev_8_21_14_0_10_34_10 TaxID=1974495 RepID=A0A2H0W858_9BACT|nr:MAG: cell division protein FtsH [Candidatus Beckwithbacteria bacterium CG10_big_fil_rev_8_21_14_0_10_34_10]